MHAYAPLQRLANLHVFGRPRPHDLCLALETLCGDVRREITQSYNKCLPSHDKNGYLSANRLVCELLGCKPSFLPYQGPLP